MSFGSRKCQFNLVFSAIWILVYVEMDTNKYQSIIMLEDVIFRVDKRITEGSVTAKNSEWSENWPDEDARFQFPNIKVTRRLATSGIFFAFPMSSFFSGNFNFWTFWEKLLSQSHSSISNFVEKTFKIRSGHLRQVGRYQLASRCQKKRRTWPLWVDDFRSILQLRVKIKMKN